ncbi:MAG: ATP synthase F1 subunit epsilon [Pseudomonadota bacterium]|nr:ATP synthase F1 subunit epsilon [Pseudomonadota bacterium]
MSTPEPVAPTQAPTSLASQEMRPPFQLDVFTLGQVVFSGRVTHVDIPGAAGRLGVLRHHTPALTVLAPGVLRYQPVEGEEARIDVLGGFAEVGPRGVRVLADRVGRDAVAEQRRMREARGRATAHPPGAERPTTPEAVKAELDAELLHFFATAFKDRRPGR